MIAAVTECPCPCDKAAMLTENDETDNLNLQYLYAFCQLTNKILTAATAKIIRRNTRANLMFSLSACYFFLVGQTVTVLGAVLLFI
jgi:hypothetical protein